MDSFAFGVVDGVLIATGYVAGRTHARQRATTTAPPAPVAVCACTHGVNFHDPDTGRCAWVDRETRERDDILRHPNGKPITSGLRDTIRIKVPETVEHACTCLRYVGPEPLPSVYAPEVGP